MRESGILLPISSLPSKYGIGCFDEEAYHFVDTLSEAKQTYWQILPLGITSYGDSPYQSYSTFAGNPYFISLNALCEKGWLNKDDLPEENINSNYVDYAFLYETRYPLLKKAYYNSDIRKCDAFIEYCYESRWWLDDYALFMAIKENYNHVSWDQWEDSVRLRDEKMLKHYTDVLEEEITYHKFIQFIFWSQWKELKIYANSKGVKIIGDIPIYIAYDSCDVWANPSLFQLDENVRPTAIAGCPPDGFSATGQLWGNPLYNWKKHEISNFKWWISRIKYCTEHYDVVRIDHFRGFDEYYAIPYGEETAINGHWEKGPGMKLFHAIEQELGKINVIAEDLGYLTDTVKKLVEDSGYTGMKLLQFGFDSRDSSGALLYQPHNYIENSVAYTGTHDNETMMGWFTSITSDEKQDLLRYLNLDNVEDEIILDACIELLMKCVSKMCLIPMPDWLKLDNSARMNTPNTIGNNWKWRMQKDAFTQELVRKIIEMTCLGNRTGNYM